MSFSTEERDQELYRHIVEAYGFIERYIWPLLVAMRNKISHSYVDVDADIVWAVVTELEEFRHLIAWAKKNILYVPAHR